MAKIDSVKIKQQCKNCKHYNKKYIDGNCEKFKQGIMSVVGTSWVDKENKCKLREV